MLGASILVVFALESAWSKNSWGSAAIVGNFMAGAVAWGAFVGLEVWVERKQKENGTVCAE